MSAETSGSRLGARSGFPGRVVSTAAAVKSAYEFDDRPVEGSVGEASGRLAALRL